MQRIWFRVGMEAEISKEELDILKSEEWTKKEKLMHEIIEKAVLSGETYIPGQLNACVEDYDNPEEDIDFMF